jgi:hypothetical protein
MIDLEEFQEPQASALEKAAYLLDVLATPLDKRTEVSAEIAARVVDYIIQAVAEQTQ